MSFFFSFLLLLLNRTSVLRVGGGGGVVSDCISSWSSAVFKNVQVDNDQENTQSERNSHSKNRGGKN